MNKSEEFLWVEKYRPTHFDNIVLDPINRKLFEQIIQKGHFPNLLFYGPPGTGKTTTIINLIEQYQKTYSKINKGNVIHLNASDERGIDIIRNQIYLQQLVSWFFQEKTNVSKQPYVSGTIFWMKFEIIEKFNMIFCRNIYGSWLASWHLINSDT